MSGRWQELTDRFAELIGDIFKEVEAHLDSWKMSPEDWESCEGKKSADYQRGYNDGIESVKGMLDTIVKEDLYT